MKNKSKKNIHEVVVLIPSTPKGALELVMGFLVSLGFPTEELIEKIVDGKSQIVFYCASKKSASDYVKRLKKIQLKGLRIKTGVLYQDDWLTRWKDDWKPFALTPSIDVVPVWCKDQYKIGRRAHLFLDTISSFGTGLHETTRFMAQFIEELHGKFESCIDVGTGTGILALVALKGSARHVEAIDMDPMCIQAAQANFKANKFDTKLIYLQDVGKFSTKKRFDLVLANLVTYDLIQMKERILALVAENGWLAVSGISLENLPQLKKAFKNLPLRCVKIKKGKQWSALLFRRQN